MENCLFVGLIVIAIAILMFFIQQGEEFCPTFLPRPIPQTNLRQTKDFPEINVWGCLYNRLMNDENDWQAQEIREALEDYFANPEAYSLYDLEEIFQDRDPFEFL